VRLFNEHNFVESIVRNTSEHISDLKVFETNGKRNEAKQVINQAFRVDLINIVRIRTLKLIYCYLRSFFISHFLASKSNSMVCQAK
jgi:hypothetical protein